MAAKKKPTLAEQKILTHPPTPKTWECRASVLRNVSDQIQIGTCGMINTGRTDKCCLCGKRKPAKPKLLWPAYVKACEKVGIEPGTRWPVREAPTEKAAPKTTRRKGPK